MPPFRRVKVASLSSGRLTDEAVEHHETEHGGDKSRGALISGGELLVEREREVRSAGERDEGEGGAAH